MATLPHSPDGSHASSDFDRFSALAKRILTTPKSELAKDATKSKLKTPNKKRK